MRWIARIGLVAVMAAGLAPSLAAAEKDTTAKPALKLKLPYVGVVTADRVYIRSGPGKNFYPTDYVSMDLAVTVVKASEHGDWLGIRPPKGSFNYVAAKFVDMQSQGVGLITGRNVLVRIGSNVSDKLAQWKQKISKPARVKVVGKKVFTVGAQTEEWVKIEPPEGELRWISGKFVKAVRRVEGPADPGTVKGPAPAPPAPDLMAKFKQAETLYKTMRAKPHRQWDFSAARQLYAEVASKSKKAWLRVLASRRLGQIASDEADRKKYQAFMNLQTDTNAKLLQLDSKKGKPAPATKKSAKPPLKPGYAQAVGMLHLTAFPLGNQGEIRHKLTVAPGNSKVVAFLHARTTSLKPYVGQRVRVVGKLAKREGWGADLILVEKVTVLKP